MRGRLSKWWHRWVLDVVLTHPPPLVAVVVAVFFTVFAVGFWCAHWLDQVDLAMYRSFSVFSDNIGGENLLGKMSGVLPIDVVYTWVNGSDPLLLEGLKAMSDSIQDSCPYSHCLPAPYINLMDSGIPKASFTTIPSVAEVTQLSITHNNQAHNFTVLRLVGEEEVPTVMERVLLIAGNTTKPKQAYWTSDVGGGWGMKQKHTVVVTGGMHLTHNTLLETLFPHHKDITSVCSVGGSGSVQLVACREEELVPSLLQRDTHLEPTTNSSIRVHQAMLMLQPDKEDHYKEVDANRFEDNEELRYSLRSLEQYAPWVRRVFLVTNGQIPHWLNLDHPRLTIVTHQDIFLNASHLPTFSSPAIESHIHKIPGLSEHFLYLNDDVMLGSEIWPEDFVSPGTGYKVYLSWSLPECSSGCPVSWLGDGYCDASCNTTACEWDGGDCAGGELGGGDLQEDEDSLGMDNTVEFCAPSCSDLWLADRYCDHSCNIQACGFDGGDCGLDKVPLLHQLRVPTAHNTTYVLPRGIDVAWMNLSSLLGADQTVQGRHSELPGIRTITLNTAQQVLILLVKPNVTAAIKIELNITSKQYHNSTQYSFIVKCNTLPLDSGETRALQQTTDAPPTNVRNFTFEHVLPKVKPSSTKSYKPEDWKFALVNVNASGLPVSLIAKILHLEALYRDEELTLKGLKWKKSSLISDALLKGSDYHLVYHSESEWLGGLRLDLNQKVEQNISLPYKSNNLNPQESKAKNTSDHKPGVRSLLWSGNRGQAHDNSHKHKTLSLSPFYKREKQNNKSNREVREAVEDNGSLATYVGSLPWERQRLFSEGGLEKSKEEEMKDQVFPLKARRHLLDMFADSLLHVNRLYNSEYGYHARRVPAHMPHFINKHVMESLQERFSEEFQLTSSHKIRQANDMQYAFSYYFFLMSEKRIRSPSEVFREFDTDMSGTLSDREIRTLLTSLHDLPLHYKAVQEFHYIVKNCSTMHHTKPVPTPVYERYADSDLPTVSLELMLKCEPLTALLKKLEKVNKYKFTHLSDDAIHFKMVTSNVSIVIHMLDEVRKNRRKFICLNSNLDPKSKVNDLVHALVQDTYESLFPVPSSFELPPNYRNRFLYVEELVAWRKWRDLVRALIYACLASLVFLTLVNFFSTELESLRRRWCRRRRRRDGYGGMKV